MGQYFEFVNIDKQEVLSPPGGLKAIERATDVRAAGMLVWLLVDGPLDGMGALLALAARDIELTLDEAEEVRNRTFEEMHHTDEERFINDARRIVAAGDHVTDRFDALGRWAGDRISLVGDYAENDLYGRTDFKDVTPIVREEMEAVLTEDWFEAPEAILAPDAVMSGLGGPPR